MEGESECRVLKTNLEVDPEMEGESYTAERDTASSFATSEKGFSNVPLMVEVREQILHHRLSSTLIWEYSH